MKITNEAVSIALTVVLATTLVVISVMMYAHTAKSWTNEDYYNTWEQIESSK